MIRPGIFIKHKRYRDICIQIIKAGWYDGYLRGRGTFWNRGYENSWPLPLPTKFKLSREELADWEWAPASAKNNLRTAEWKKVG